MKLSRKRLIALIAGTTIVLGAFAYVYVHDKHASHRLNSLPCRTSQGDLPGEVCQ